MIPVNLEIEVSSNNFELIRRESEVYSDRYWLDSSGQRVATEIAVRLDTALRLGTKEQQAERHAYGARRAQEEREWAEEKDRKRAILEAHPFRDFKTKDDVIAFLIERGIAWSDTKYTLKKPEREYSSWGYQPWRVYVRRAKGQSVSRDRENGLIYFTSSNPELMEAYQALENAIGPRGLFGSRYGPQLDLALGSQRAVRT